MDHEDLTQEETDAIKRVAASHFRPTPLTPFMKSFYSQHQYPRYLPRWIPTGIVWYDRMIIIIGVVGFIGFFLGTLYLFAADAQKEAARKNASPAAETRVLQREKFQHGGAEQHRNRQPWARKPQ